MSVLKTSQLRRAMILQLCTAIAGFIVCLFFSIPAAAVLLCVAAVSTAVQVCLWSRRQKKLSELCDEIDRILHGAEHVTFDMFQEGELSLLGSEIQKMTVRLREQNSMLQQDKSFLKEALEDMSHQLRTPLTTMTLILGMLREPELTKRQRIEYVQELCTMLAKMQWIVETLLNLSRLEAGAVTFRTEKLLLSDLVNDAVTPFSIALELKEIALSVNIDGDPCIYGDRRYLCEAIENLIKNCLEHTPRGGSIAIDGCENSIFTGLTVTDSGEGISDEDLPHIFERFYRSSDFAKNGYGIGLAFARKIVAMHGGSLQVKNACPHGAQFDMRIYRHAPR